jgi:hypothetical protein
MGRKRGLVGFCNRPLGGAVAVKSRKLARKLTSAYHVIQNEVPIEYHLCDMTSVVLCACLQSLTS